MKWCVAKNLSKSQFGDSGCEDFLALGSRSGLELDCLITQSLLWGVSGSWPLNDTEEFFTPLGKRSTGPKYAPTNKYFPIPVPTPNERLTVTTYRFQKEEMLLYSSHISSCGRNMINICWAAEDTSYQRGMKRLCTRPPRGDGGTVGRV